MFEELEIRPYHWTLFGLTAITVINLGSAIASLWELVTPAVFALIFVSLLLVAIAIGVLSYLQSKSIFLTATIGGVFLLIFILLTIGLILL